jgi:hypothetical protein
VAPRLVVSGCLALFLTLARGPALGFAAPPQPLTGSPADLLLATDRAGDEHALARRMGIQEIIWDCRSWWAGSERMGEYSVCFGASGKPRPRVSTTLAHRDHIHLGLSRAGAAKRTSFWR